MYYKCGKKPETGDIVECVDKSNSSGYGITTLKLNTNYKVIGVIHLSTGTLVKIKDMYGTKREYSSNRFKLISRYNEQCEETNKKLPTFIIANELGKVIKVGFDDSTEVLKTLLKENPYSIFHVFKYEYSAKVPTPKLEFFNAKSVTDTDKLVKKDSKMFTKK